MARRATSRSPAPAPVPRVLAGGFEETTNLDRTIHQPVRLAIVSALAVAERMSFNQLKEALEVSDGNLSVHARKLEEQGYLACNKRFSGRVPRTEYRLTAKGREALERYLRHMKSLIAALR